MQRDCPRITPACAGKRAGLALLLPPRRGSPPRMRGKVPHIQLETELTGITPACAGKRPWWCSGRRSGRDHPRVCGEKPREFRQLHAIPGSPPRVRGKADHARHLRHGLILHASRSAGQGRRLCPGPCPDTAGSGTPRGPSPAKRPHTSPPAATPAGCRAWQSGATAPGSR